MRSPLGLQGQQDDLLDMAVGGDGKGNDLAGRLESIGRFFSQAEQDQLLKGRIAVERGGDARLYGLRHKPAIHGRTLC